MWQQLKSRLLSDQPRRVRILFGPFRGACLLLRPRDNLRKIFGLYEHELNGWLSYVLPRVDTVLDVGANDGYFTFGCATIFNKLKRKARIFAFEPLAACCEQMEASRDLTGRGLASIVIKQNLVGRPKSDGLMCLDAFAVELDQPIEGRALLKIDVEGAEMDVIDGASLWMNPSNYFIIEVHNESFLSPLKARFAEQGIILEQKSQKALPFLGMELRSQQNWWLVSTLDE